MSLITSFQVKIPSKFLFLRTSAVDVSLLYTTLMKEIGQAANGLQIFAMLKNVNRPVFQVLEFLDWIALLEGTYSDHLLHLIITDS